MPNLEGRQVLRVSRGERQAQGHSQSLGTTSIPNPAQGSQPSQSSLSHRLGLLPCKQRHMRKSSGRWVGR